MLAQVRLSELPDVASLKVNIDQQRLAALGLTSNDVNSTLSTAWGGRYVNDFIDRGRVKRVYVQGEPHIARIRPTSANGSSATTRGNGALLVVRQHRLADGPTTLDRFLGYPSYEFRGRPHPEKAPARR